MICFRWIPAVFATLAATLLAGCAAAQVAETSEAPARPNWLVNCTNVSQADALQCSMSQSVVLTATGARVLTVSVQEASDADRPTMMVTLPHGLFLPAGVRMLIDGEQKDVLTVQTCEAAGCYAARPIDDGLLKALKRGSQLVFVIQDLQKRDIELKLELEGFSDAFTTLER